ncbi:MULTISPECIES: alpha/beta-type small acid-soluble spore protein [Thermovenabulum]|uniref:Small, acid-soluble spore protein C2 n=1 Tax=Thermovenabulum gondwanense TaxID=520767 RepID=A0A162MN46_9FIRM|nr:alpha/beta-type small acid-soluble spore protein [Thermovenabulum gondwanense]KYO66760.1 Small, acid-soluble spore protein C2 [Thermovenabulum gondwanense]
MALGQKRNKLVVPEARRAMEQFKAEIAREVGITAPPDGYWGNYSARDCGAVGGHMVKRMIEDYERRLSGGTPTQ